MHFRFLVTCRSDAAKNATQARRYAAQTLYEKDFVCSDNAGGSCMADWFVIGGRWSGELSRHSWAKRITEEMDALEESHGIQVWGMHYGDEEQRHAQRQLADRFQQLWEAAAPCAFRGIPIQRDTYKVDGYEDDAMLVTQELYDALLKEYEGEHTTEYHTDLDGEAVSPAMVGRKWMVVVDYHI